MSRLNQVPAILRGPARSADWQMGRFPYIPIRLHDVALCHFVRCLVRFPITEKGTDVSFTC